MMHAVGTVLAFMVFAGLWLLSQDWIDALPKRLARGIGSFVAVTLLGTLYLAPDAYEAGTRRFANYIVEKFLNQVDNSVRDPAGDRSRVSPSSTSTSRPSTGPSDHP